MRLDGRIGAVTLGDASKIDVFKLFFPRRLTLSMELMLSCAWEGCKESQQGAILGEVADLVDKGSFVSIMNERLDGLSVENVKAAQNKQDSGKAIGKTSIAC